MWRILNHLLPPRCLLCGAPAENTLGLCTGCRADLPRNRHACALCALPVPPGQAVCGRCQSDPPGYSRLLAPYRYRPPMDRLILDLKFGGRLEVATLVGTLLAESIAGMVEKPPQMILPVPLHPARLRRRGFNQAAEIAAATGALLGCPVAAGLIARVRATAAQTGLDAAGRRRNVKGAFSIGTGFHAAHVAIVDDVVTTGSTVAEVARLLRRAGAERVEIWCCARAARDRPH